MEKLKLYYKKYVNYIVIILLVAFGLKSCQSCSRARQLEFYKSQTVLAEDSLKNDINTGQSYADSLLYELKLVQQENKQLKQENKLVKDINEQYKKANNELLKTNRNLSITETNKERKP